MDMLKVKTIVSMMFVATAAAACGSEKTGGGAPTVTDGKCEPQDTQAPTSSQGATGPQGPPGPQGPAGPTGSQGPQGEPGAAGPQGEVGPPGPQGAPGTPGAPGAPGTVGKDGVPRTKADLYAVSELKAIDYNVTDEVRVTCNSVDDIVLHGSCEASTANVAFTVNRAWSPVSPTEKSGWICRAWAYGAGGTNVTARATCIKVQ